jgi:hypothetical protein
MTDAVPGVPRWVKVVLVVVAVVVLLAAVAVLTGLGGEHGPGRHTSSDAIPAPVPASVPRPA